MKKFIFDVDGTLTPSRQKIDDDFAVFFTTFCTQNDVYLVTGSDRDKTVEQVSEEVYSLHKRVYNCLVAMFMKVINVYTNDWTLPPNKNMVRKYFVSQVSLFYEQDYILKKDLVWLILVL